MSKKILALLLFAGLAVTMPALASADGVTVQVYGNNNNVSVYVQNGAEPRASSSPIGCGEEINLRSLATRTSTVIGFVNRSGAIKNVYWIDHWGNRVLYASLVDSNYIEFQTYISHPWVVTSRDGECDGIYMPSSNPQMITLR